MKVKELIKQLKNYNRNEEILVLYFDKESTEDYLEQTLTADQWARTVEQVEKIEMPEIDYIGETINDQAEKVLREGRKSNV
jgi:hypothetical protein